MIVAALVLAAGAAEAPSPESVADAAPAAWAQLYSCATDGCDPSHAARAAWLAALHRYLSEGVADGALSALVRQLDVELFDALPDVIAQAATAPPAWAVRTHPATDEPAPPSTWPPISVAHRDGTLVPGFYRSVEELRNNAPSEPWSAPTLTAARSSAVGGHVAVLYSLKRRDVGGMGRVLGFSDGTDVYLSVGGRLGRPHSISFAEATLVGPVAFYTSGNAIPAAGVVIQFGEQHLFDLEQGTNRTLTPKRLRAMLSDRPELQAAFDAESNKGRVLLDYLRRLYEDVER